MAKAPAGDDRRDDLGKADPSAGGAAKDAFRRVRFTVRDGLSLSARDYGRDRPGVQARLPVICLPGLTRNARDFHQLALGLSGASAAPRRVVAFDYRGRGESDWDRDKSRYTIAVEAEDVLAGAAALGIERAAFIGTSRGALIIHLIAGMRPAVLAAAVLNDAGPVIEGEGLVQIKGYLERMPRPATWQEAAAVLEDAHGRAFPALGEEDWRDMAAAIFTDRSGRLAADFDPALVALLKDVDFNTRIPTLWPQFAGLARIPLMTIRGERSSLLSQRTVAEMAARHPGMTLVEAAGQGHAPLLHRDGLPEEIARFLDRADKAAGCGADGPASETAVTEDPASRRR